MSRYSARDKAWMKKVMTIEKGQCAITGNPADDVHHIAGKQAWPAMRWDLLNGIALSRAWHRWAHDHPEAFRAWLQVARPKQWAWVEAAKRTESRTGGDSEAR